MRLKEIKPGMVIHCPKEEEEEALARYLMQRNDLDFIYTDPKDEVGYFFFVCDIDGRPEDVTDDEITEFSDLIEPEPRFKPGDKVRVRKGLTRKYYDGEVWFNDDMAKLEGQVFTIGDCCQDGTWYHLKEDKQEWTWIAEMLESVESSTDGENSTEMSAVEVLEWFRENYENHDAMRKVFGHDLAFHQIIVDNSPQKIIENITAYEAAKKAPKPMEVEIGYYCKIYTETETVAEFTDWEIDEPTAKERAKEVATKHAEEWGEPTFADVHFVCRVKESEQDD